MKDEILMHNQYRILKVHLIPFEDRQVPFNLEKFRCEDLIDVVITNENMSLFDSIKVNKYLKVRTIKKILKHRYALKYEWPIVYSVDETNYDDYSQIERYLQFNSMISINFHNDDSIEIMIRDRNGEFKYQVSIKDNFRILKNNLCKEMFLGEDIILADAFGNRFSEFNAVWLQRMKYGYS
jgi:hypothetical protein